MNRKLILESILFLLLGIYTTDQALACYTQLHQVSISQAVRKIPKPKCLPQVEVMSSNVIYVKNGSKCSTQPQSEVVMSSNVIYMKNTSDHQLQYQSFSLAEFSLLERLAKKINNTKEFNEIMEKSLIVDRDHFMQIVENRLREPSESPRLAENNGSN